MVSRRFVMNRRLFSYSELPLATPFRLLRLVKRKVWPLPCSHTLSQPWLCSRGDLPIAFRGTVIFSATFPSLTASPLSFVAVLTRSSCLIVPMMQSTLPNTPRTSILFLLLYATSPKCRTIGNVLSVLQAASTSALRCSEVWCLRLRVW